MTQSTDILYLIEDELCDRLDESVRRLRDFAWFVSNEDDIIDVLIFNGRQIIRFDIQEYNYNSFVIDMIGSDAYKVSKFVDSLFTEYKIEDNQPTYEEFSQVSDELMDAIFTSVANNYEDIVINYLVSQLPYNK